MKGRFANAAQEEPKIANIEECRSYYHEVTNELKLKFYVKC